jgi:hypothetical protein
MRSSIDGIDRHRTTLSFRSISPSIGIRSIGIIHATVETRETWTLVVSRDSSNTPDPTTARACPGGTPSTGRDSMNASHPHDGAIGRVERVTVAPNGTGGWDGTRRVPECATDGTRDVDVDVDDDDDDDDEDEDDVDVETRRTRGARRKRRDEMRL